MAESIRKQTINGVFWSATERFSVQGSQFVVQIIMARILAPSDYGLVGMLAIFMAISQSIIDSGFSTALVQKKNRTETDFSTVFYFNIIVGLTLYFVLFICSPLVADFYDAPILKDLTRVISLNLFIHSLSVVQRAKLTIDVNFKTQAKASMISVIISGCVGIWMAYQGYGVWSIAFQSVINGFINTILLWIYSKWKPKKGFSRDSFIQLFSFGSKLLVAGILNTIYNNLYSIIIGKKFSQQSLGYFMRADQFAQLPSSNIANIISRVMFPIISNIQDDNERLRHIFLKYMKMSAFIVFPLMIGLAALAKPLIYTLLADKWAESILLLQIICFAYMWYPIHAINLNLLQVKGRSDLFLQLEIIKKIIGILILFITTPKGVTCMCYGIVVLWIVGLAINTYYTKKIIQIGFFTQMKTILPVLFYALSMGGAIWLSTLPFESNILKLIIGTITGIIYYLTISFIFGSKELKEIILLIKKR